MHETWCNINFPYLHVGNYLYYSNNLVFTHKEINRLRMIHSPKSFSFVVKISQCVFEN